MNNNKVNCSHCGSLTWKDEIDICDDCGEEVCPECKDLEIAIETGCMVHSFHECDGTCDYCETRICYNDDCEKWDIEDHFGQTKSQWDEELEFRASLDPNDPADAWFFED